MKKTTIYLVAFLGLAAVFSSCTKDVSFDEALLVGKWVSGTEYYKYNADHTGGTWDISDNVTEAEAQPFTWTLDKADLTQIHIMTIGGNVPKHYTVTELTSTTLKYKDDFNVAHSYTKVSK